MTLTVILVANLGTLGFETGSTYVVSRRSDAAPAALSASLLLVVAGGTLLLVALSALANSFGDRLFPHAPPGTLMIASLAIPPLMFSALLLGLLVALDRMVGAYWLNALGVAVALVLAVGFGLSSTEPLHRLLIAFVLAAFSASGLLLLAVVRARGVRLGNPRPLLKEVLGFSLTSHAANILHLLHLRLDVFVVNLFLSSSEVGLYALAQAVCEWVWLLPRSAAATLFPAVAGTDSQTALAATARTSRFILAICGLASLALASAAGPLLTLLFGPAFAPAALPLRALLPGVWVGSVAGVLSAYLTGRGHPRYPLLNSLVSLLANLGLNLLTIPRFGIVGAALASTITYTLGTALNLVFLRRLAQVPLRDLLLLNREDVRGIWRRVKS